MMHASTVKAFETTAAPTQRRSAKAAPAQRRSASVVWRSHRRPSPPHHCFRCCSHRGRCCSHRGRCCSHRGRSLLCGEAPRLACAKVHVCGGSCHASIPLKHGCEATQVHRAAPPRTLRTRASARRTDKRQSVTIGGGTLWHSVASGGNLARTSPSGSRCSSSTVASCSG